MTTPLQVKKPSKRRIISETLRQEILKGLYPEGTPMPGEHALSRRFGVSYATMRLAVGDLEATGFLERRHGSGTYANPTRSVMPQSLGILLLERHKAATVGMSALISGATAYLDSIGSHITILHQPPETWNTLLIRSMAGVLVVPTQITEDHLAAIDALGLPRISITDNDLSGFSIKFGLAAAAAQVTRELLELGHRRFAILSGHDEHSDRIRKTSIAETLEAAGIPFDSVPDFRTNYQTEPAWEATRQLIQIQPRPTAVIAFDDTLALQMIRVAQENGLSIPRDLSITGFNDAPHASLVMPSISTLRIPFYEAGRRAAEALCLTHLRKQPLADIPLASEWIARESTGPAPQS